MGFFLFFCNLKRVFFSPYHKRFSKLNAIHVNGVWPEAHLFRLSRKKDIATWIYMNDCWLVGRGGRTRNTWEIPWIIILFIFFSLAAIVVFFCLKRKKKKKSTVQNNSMISGHECTLMHIFARAWLTFDIYGYFFSFAITAIILKCAIWGSSGKR